MPSSSFSLLQLLFTPSTLSYMGFFFSFGILCKVSETHFIKLLHNDNKEMKLTITIGKLDYKICDVFEGFVPNHYGNFESLKPFAYLHSYVIVKNGLPIVIVTLNGALVTLHGTRSLSMKTKCALIITQSGLNKILKYTFLYVSLILHWWMFFCMKTLVSILFT